MATVQKMHTQEFKKEAVRLLETSGKSAAQLARDLGVTDSSLYHWRKQLRLQGEQAFPGPGHQTAPDEELRRLRRENEILRQERAILKRSSHLLGGTAMTFRFIEEHTQHWPVARICRIFGVSVSG
jgi:transposase